jgi:hypothetical protein
MIDIPIGKALVPVETELALYEKCADCLLNTISCKYLYCLPSNRADHKHVVFKLVDWPAKEEK